MSSHPEKSPIFYTHAKYRPKIPENSRIEFFHYNKIYCKFFIDFIFLNNYYTFYVIMFSQIVTMILTYANQLEALSVVYNLYLYLADVATLLPAWLLIAFRWDFYYNDLLINLSFLFSSTIRKAAIGEIIFWNGNKIHDNNNTTLFTVTVNNTHNNKGVS